MTVAVLVHPIRRQIREPVSTSAPASRAKRPGGSLPAGARRRGPRRTAAGGSGRGGVAGHLRCGDPGDRPQPGLEPHRAAGCRQPDRALLAEHCKHRRPARGGGRRPRRLRLGVLAGERRHAEWLAVPCRCSGRLDTVGGSDDRHHLRRLGQRGFALRGQLPGDHAHAAPWRPLGRASREPVDGPQSVQRRAGGAGGRQSPGRRGRRRGLPRGERVRPDQRRGRPGRLPLVSGRQQLHHTGHRRPLWHEPEPDHRGWRLVGGRLLRRDVPKRRPPAGAEPDRQRLHGVAERGAHLFGQLHPDHPVLPRRRRVPRRLDRGHRLRHRQHLHLESDQPGHRHRLALQQPLGNDTRREHGYREPRPRRCARQRAAPGGRRHDGGYRLRPERLQRLGRLAGADRRPGDRVGRHCRPRSRLPGPHRPDDQRRADLRRQVRCPARHHGLGLRLPERPARDRRRKRDDRHHHGGLWLDQPGGGLPLRGGGLHRLQGQRDRRLADVPPRPAADR